MKYRGKDYDNHPFYASTAWRKVSAAYLSSKYYVCERCGKPAQICHHKIWLNGTNVHDPKIALSFDNLEALCIPCHTAIHQTEEHNRVVFDEHGNIKAVKETSSAEDFKLQRAAIEKMLGGMP